MCNHHAFITVPQTVAYKMEVAIFGFFIHPSSPKQVSLMTVHTQANKKYCEKFIELWFFLLQVSCFYIIMYVCLPQQIAS